MSSISIPIESTIISEIILRAGRAVDVSDLITNITLNFLERTRGDPDIWSEEHAEQVAQELEDEEKSFGDPAKGYQWASVFLPNGTELMTEYKGQTHKAYVRHQQLYFNDKPCSPSQFASAAANNTSRNAWRDLWVKRPNEKWTLANSLRR